LEVESSVAFESMAPPDQPPWTAVHGRVIGGGPLQSRAVLTLRRGYRSARIPGAASSQRSGTQQ
ncbi:MAG: hypothetical protein PVJ95_02020, partial [Cellvibrionales bacterium]